MTHDITLPRNFDHKHWCHVDKSFFQRPAARIQSATMIVNRKTPHEAMCFWHSFGGIVYNLLTRVLTRVTEQCGRRNCLHSTSPRVHHPFHRTMWTLVLKTLPLVLLPHSSADERVVDFPSCYPMSENTLWTLVSNTLSLVLLPLMIIWKTIL